MSDIFKSNIEHGGSWQLDGAVISLDGESEDLMVNSCSISYARPVNKVMPLNTNKQYIIAGKGAGQAQLGLLIGPSKGIKTFLEKFANACNVKENTLTITAANNNACTGDNSIGEPLTFICRYCLIQSITASVTAGDLAIVAGGMSLVVGELDLK